MGTVNDPNFWKRFSVAVHNADAEKEEQAKGPHANLKHSYVISLEETSTMHSTTSPIATPTSESPLSPIPLCALAPPPKSPAPDKEPLSPPLPTRSPSRRLQKPRPGSAKSPRSPGLPKSPRSPRRPSLAHIHFPFTQHNNASNMSLGFSGRPASRFKFWTSITADPTNRDSWLEGQRRKKKQRTWICWAFWLGLMVLVGGVVAAVLILRSRGIL